MILIVDDHADTCEALTRFIEEDGYQVATASNGAEALALMQGVVPQLVILDNNMPGVSGEGILFAMRNSARLVNVPVVFFSADSTPEAQVRAIMSGAQEYFVKGRNWEDLSSLVRSLAQPSAAMTC